MYDFLDTENYEKHAVIYQRDYYRLVLLQNRADKAVWKIERFQTLKRWFRAETYYWMIVQWGELGEGKTLQSRIDWINEHFEPVWHKEFDNVRT